MKRFLSIHPDQRVGVRKRMVEGLGAALYALLFALCSQIDQTGSTRASATLLRFACAFPASWAALHVLFRYVMPGFRFRQDKADAFKTWIAFAVLFVCYVPMFLIQYPGSFTYDVLKQAYQAASDSYNTFHPLLHTLLLRLCVGAYDLMGSFERCMALCSVIQMAAVAACFALLCSSISRSCSRLAARLAVVFFALYPSHMAFASTYTKDVLFSACFALFLALCFEEIRLGRLTLLSRGIQIVSGVLACLLRNNMIYAMAVWFALLLLCRRSLRMALCSLLIIVLACGANTALVALTHAGPGSVREMLSVPAQQLARARLEAADRLTAEQCRQMDALFADVVYERYDQTIADPIKDRIDDEAFLRDPLGAAGLWLSIGAKCPEVYLDAFLNMALPALYPYSQYKVSARYIEVGACSVGLTDPYGLAPLKQPGRFEGVRQWLNKHIFDTGADHHPLLRWLFNSGLIFWVLLLHVLYEMYEGNWTKFTVMLLPVLLWGTYLLGPVMQGRYLYPFVCVLPLLVLRPCEKREPEPGR